MTTVGRPGRPGLAPASLTSVEAVATRSVLVLDDGRKLEHPAPVRRWDVVELEDGALFFVTAIRPGVDRTTGQAVTLARASAVKP